MSSMVHDEPESEKKTIDAIAITPLAHVNIPRRVDVVPENNSIKSLSSDIKQSKWKIVKDSTHQICPQFSKGETKLSNLISELQNFSIDGQVETSDKIPPMNSNNWIKISRRHLNNFLLQSKFHYSIIILVIIDIMVVLVDLILAQLSSPCLTESEMEQYNTTIQRDTCLLPYSVDLSRGELFLFYFSLFLLIIFVFEVFISFYVFGWRHYTNPLYLIDGIIVFASFIMELYFHYGNIGRAGRAAAAIVILRLWKIVRAIHAVAHSITLKNRLLIKKIQEAQILIEEDKQNTEKLLEKQDIKVEYLMSILKAVGKLPNLGHIENYVDKTWQQRKKTI